MPNYYRIQDVSKEVSRYIAEKGLKTSPNSWRDIYAAEHANAFTVARLKDLNLLGNVQKEVARSIENGDTFEDFRKRMKPKLQSWLDSVRKSPPPEVEGPELDKWKKRKDNYRLRRIFETNTRQAYANHHYNRGMDNPLVTHVIYRIGPSIHHRVDHVALDGIVLPKNDPFWDTHWPPNGWGCKCYTRFITKDTLERYRKEGVQDLNAGVEKDKKGRPTGRLRKKMKPINEVAPPIRYRRFERSDGQVVNVPADIDPGFEWNAGKVNRNTWLKDQAIRKANAIAKAMELQGGSLNSQKIMQTLAFNRHDREAYNGLIEKHYERQGTGKLYSVGLVPRDSIVKHRELMGRQDKEFADMPGTPMLLMSDNVPSMKQIRHKNDGSGISKADFLKLPQLLAKPLAVLWDNKNKNYVYLGWSDRRPKTLLLAPVQVKFNNDLKQYNWELLSAYTNRRYVSLEVLLDLNYGKEKRFTKIK